MEGSDKRVQVAKQVKIVHDQTTDSDGKYEEESPLPPLSLERTANQPAITEFCLRTQLNKKEKLQNRQQSRVIKEKQVSREERMEAEKTKQEKKNQADEANEEDELEQNPLSKR